MARRWPVLHLANEKSVPFDVLPTRVWWELLLSSSRVPTLHDPSFNPFTRHANLFVFLLHAVPRPFSSALISPFPPLVLSSSTFLHLELTPRDVLYALATWDRVAITDHRIHRFSSFHSTYRTEIRDITRSVHERSRREQLRRVNLINGYYRTSLDPRTSVPLVLWHLINARRACKPRK